MAENITQPVELDADTFLQSVEHKRRREDALALLPLFKDWTGMQPVVWANGLAGKPSSGILGFGHYHYKYKSGREGDWFLTGFSPRKQNLAVYIMPRLSPYEDLLEKLGPHKHSVSCLYLTNLAKNDLNILEKLVRSSLEIMKETYDWRTS
ncbi:MAG: DUF1801 domain-containing protein [Pseudomonadota bacterium]